MQVKILRERARRRSLDRSRLHSLVMAEAAFAKANALHVDENYADASSFYDEAIQLGACALCANVSHTVPTYGMRVVPCAPNFLESIP
jgi:hypothetical protein